MGVPGDLFRPLRMGDLEGVKERPRMHRMDVR